ncbi:MAG TPA: hypothetical protein VK158_01040 [Acidobacteriota bacterium]|nr:hypothetical protein [Acidobacteriota bacterium]
MGVMSHWRGKMPWAFILTLIIIFKVFEEIFRAFLVPVEFTLSVYFFSHLIFAFIFLIALAGVLWKKVWGVSIAIYIAVLDIISSSYLGGKAATISVVVSLLIVLISLKSYKELDK